MAIKTPAYFVYYAKTYKLESTPDGGLAGYLLNLKTGDFEERNDLIDKVLWATTGEIDPVDEASFIDGTEIARAEYLRGDGPIFALYETIEGLHDQAEAEGRRVAKDELALIRSLRRRTFKMWEEEFARRAAGEPPTFGYRSLAV
jgi:hypothetical protein